MSVYKCKMCGGTLGIPSGETVAVCEYCGTKQTLPRLDTERKANLYDRANHFRRNNEFDKAISIYEQILNEDSADADTYWSLVLCRYGIEYVEEPDTHKRVPTVNRAQFTSVFDDANYKLALQYADNYQRGIYEEEAKAINEIQKKILAISQQEEPFDVFICYKEKDGSGKRTPDSVLAQELYYELTEEGFKVFFARITLEDKLGSAYEPYIFAALNSAKVMVVLGTKPGFFNSAWVKNEWSRYLALIKDGARKTLIPAYKDMDPYDLPEEFSHLQAQDVSKLGFMQDLIRGIKKIVQAEEGKESGRETITGTESVPMAAAASTASLMKRAFMFLEDGNWESADEYCERVLDIEPENAQAYLGKLMAELEVRKQPELAGCEEVFQDNLQYQKVMRFGDEKLREELKGYISAIEERNENMRLEEAYIAAVRKMESAKKADDFKEAAQAFEAVREYKDSEELIETCYKCWKDAVYKSAKYKIWREDYEEAIKLFETISGWKDAEEQISDCRKKQEEKKAALERARLERRRKAELERLEAEKRAKRNKIIGILLASGSCAVIIFLVILFHRVISPDNKYNAAVDLMKEKKYKEAVTELIALDGYKDSEQQINNCYIERYGEDAYNKVKDIQIGDTYTFGAYRQNAENDDKKEIEWIVLDKKGIGLLLISRYVLDYKEYSSSREYNVVWENCSLREWLNETFINDAFNSEEQDMILPVKLDTASGEEHSIMDKIFLLNAKEAEKYFASDSERDCNITEYLRHHMEHSDCRWWLRNPGNGSQKAVVVGIDGAIDVYGEAVTKAAGVRPVMWVFPKP